MIFNYAIDILGLAITLVIMASERKNKLFTGNLRWTFGSTLYIIAIVFISDIFAWLIMGKTFRGAWFLSYTLNTIYYIAQILFCFLWLMLAYCWSGFKQDNLKKRVALYSIPAIAEIILIFINLKTHWIFEIDELNRYSRGDFYRENLTPYLFYISMTLIVSLISHIKSKDEVQKKQSIQFLIYMIFPIIGMGFQMLNYGVSLLWPFAVLALIMIYFNMQQQNLIMNKLAIAEARQNAVNAYISIMLSQMQPHFLYNSLAVIKELCNSDPKLAAQVTVDFSNYLRGNLDSIKSSNPIRFVQELEHTKTFMKLEQMQYGDNLEVLYDIKAENFLIPTLTLQPIAENAVKYGMKHKEHVRVEISSREDENYYYVCVKDDGMGFDPEAPSDKARSHIGINNVRTRLAVQSGSRLIIDSVKGVGTTVTIKIPKESVV